MNISYTLHTFTALLDQTGVTIQVQLFSCLTARATTAKRATTTHKTLHTILIRSWITVHNPFPVNHLAFDAQRVIKWLHVYRTLRTHW